MAVSPIAWILDSESAGMPIEDMPVLDGPLVDLEVLVAPRVRARPGEDEQQLRERVVRRGRKLLEPLRRRSPCARILLAVGDPEVERPPDGLDATGLWTDALNGLPDGVPGTVMLAPSSSSSALLPAFTTNQRTGSTVVAAFGVAESEAGDAPYAHVIVVALGEDSDVDATQTFVREFADRHCRTTPLYVIGVSVTGSRDTARWARLRASVVLTARTGSQDDIATVSRTSVDAQQRTADVSVVPCPTFEAGINQPGAAQLRIDVVKGQAQIAFNYDLGYDVRRRPVQVVRALHSASRISVGERRLYGHVTELVERARDRRPEDVAEVDAFLASIHQEWQRHGHVQLCTEDTRLAGLHAVKSMSYMLLLVIRPREGGGYELLLSNHSPLQASPFGEWNTLLLPAFQYPASLLGHLRDDVMRQATERGEDLERGDHAIAFEEALGRILRSSDLEEDVWADQVREIAGFTTRKISPTSGVVTEYEYHFVTLLPFIERATSTSDETARDAKKLIAWFRDLDRVQDDLSSVDSPRGLAMAALREGGAAVRFEPTAELVADPGAEQRAQAEKAPPGVVWFPLGSPGERAPWREVPAIVARNADVMAQLDGILRKHLEAGELPAELILGGSEPRQVGYEVLRTYSWADPADNPDDEVPGLSTTDALAKVAFAPSSDLQGLAYPDGNFRRVYLLRFGFGARRPDRDAILVFDADALESKDRGEVTADDALGLLRPVQRYVLEKGLRRVRDLKPVFDRLKDEGRQWGFARVRKDGVGMAVSVTPPILEQLHEHDLGEPLRGGAGDRDRVREFIVCDGTHRVVEQAWRQGEALPAVLVDSQPRAPYYALPFGALEWDVTAARPMATTPGQSAKYTTRTVTRDDARDTWNEVELIPESSRYRRYYRNLEAGFGRLGGQGGRFA